jgi:hypothetical protein
VAQTGSEWFEVDLGKRRGFSALTLDAGAHEKDYARGFVVEVSDDGASWSEPLATGAGEDALTTVRFARQEKRFVRVRQTGTSASWWSIHELDLHDE